MKILKTDIEGLLIIEPVVYEDARGYFYEIYNEEKFHEAGIRWKFIQDNQSKSHYGVIRGLHYQLEPYSQTKLICVLDGKILDVVIDIRTNSPTFGKCFDIELSCENKKQLLVPKGFAHGFSVLSETAVVFYKCDCLYRSDAERGINVLDTTLNIDWKIAPSDMVLSRKDKAFPPFEMAEMNFIYGEV